MASTDAPMSSIVHSTSTSRTALAGCLRKCSLAGLALLLGASALGGCAKPMIAAQGTRGIPATYSGSRLTATLPEEARVPAVIAAAEQTARARSYSIQTSTATEETGRVICLPPRSDSFPRAAIYANRTGLGTMITIDYQPFGDQEVCRSLLDGILQKLGL